MRAVIPVAGIGTRLKPHTFSTPKVLLNVGGKPIIAHILDKLLEEGISKATFVIGYLGDMIKEYIEKTYPSMQSSFVEQETMEGLGHAIYTAIPTFDDDEIFIILGDTIFDVNLKNVFRDKISSYLRDIR
jgi:glucose-1-phosphate thymidylyltransferase